MSENDETETEKAPVQNASSCDSAALSSRPRASRHLANFSPKARKRLWAVAVLMCAVAIVAGTYLTYTAYLAGDFLKSVAATGTSQSLFGSDMLAGYTQETLQNDDIAVRSVIVNTSGGEECSFTFKIYNYLPGDKNRVNDKDINATLEIYAADASSWRVSGSPAIGAGQNVLLSFPANNATDYTYTVTFPKSDLGKASFTIKVQVASGSSGTNLKWLAARVAPSERAEVTAAGVTGDWVDKAGNIAGYDAYNYRVTVTGAKSRVTLAWGEGVELDPHFGANHPGATIDKETRAATFDMEPGSEIVNFYKNGKANPSSWESLDVSVGGQAIADSGGSTGN